MVGTFLGVCYKVFQCLCLCAFGLATFRALRVPFWGEEKGGFWLVSPRELALSQFSYVLWCFAIFRVSASRGGRNVHRFGAGLGGLMTLVQPLPLFTTIFKAKKTCNF